MNKIQTEIDKYKKVIVTYKNSCQELTQEICKLKSKINIVSQNIISS